MKDTSKREERAGGRDEKKPKKFLALYGVRGNSSRGSQGYYYHVIALALPYLIEMNGTQ